MSHTPRSQLNAGRDWIYRTAILVYFAGTVAFGIKTGLYLHRHEASQARLSVYIAILAIILIFAFWSMWRLPEVGFRMAVPSIAVEGGCIKCDARYVGMTACNGSSGIVVWHDVHCPDGARVETRVGVSA